MNAFDALILGLVQGLTEFIPVSSSGHLILFAEWLGLDSSFSYDLILNIGTLLAAILYFHTDITKLVSSPKTNPLTRLLILGTIPAIIFGVLFKSVISSDEIRSVPVVASMLLIIGVLFIFESKLRGGGMKISNLKPKQAIYIGLAQALALVPGTSRSGSTILMGRFMGLSRTESARFSFLLSIPIIAGAITFALISDPLDFSNISISNIIIGIVTSFLSSLVAIHYMIKFLQKSGLFVFGIYRVVIACMLLFLL